MRKAGFAILAMALAAAAGAAPRAEILWDTWGVPHIFAKDAESLFYAFGWAQAASHGDLLLRLYGQARGRGAEYFGEEHLERDRALRTYGVPARARQWYEAQSPAFRRNLDAFAAGVNAYAAKHPERIAAPVRDLLPITATDVLAHTQRIIHFTFVAPPNLAAQVGAELALPFRAQQAAPLHMPAGSNAWAIGPQRSASKKAMLLANPHLPWSDFYLFYEAHLVAPGINAHGATLVGFPVLGIAFNDFLGWTHTVNAYDGADLYRLTLVEGGYRWDGDIRPFETEEQTLKIKGKDGKLREEKLVIRRSIHGPAFTAKGAPWRCASPGLTSRECSSSGGTWRARGTCGTSKRRSNGSSFRCSPSCTPIVRETSCTFLMAASRCVPRAIGTGRASCPARLQRRCGRERIPMKTCRAC